MSESQINGDQIRSTATVQVAAVGVGTSGLDPSAALQVDSTTKGVLYPRMTTAQRLAISSPAAGLAVIDTTLGASMYYTGAFWTKIGIGVLDNIQTSLSGDVLVGLDGKVIYSL